MVKCSTNNENHHKQQMKVAATKSRVTRFTVSFYCPDIRVFDQTEIVPGEGNNMVKCNKNNNTNPHQTDKTPWNNVVRCYKLQPRKPQNAHSSTWHEWKVQILLAHLRDQIRMDGIQVNRILLISLIS